MLALWIVVFVYRHMRIIFSVSTDAATAVPRCLQCCRGK
jgi:hypothetical protein